jgi:glycosyltransferase involved in cell wall biosynthesis
MIQPTTRRPIRILDRLITTRILRRAQVVIALTETEANGLRRLGARPWSVRLIGNGVPASGTVASFNSTPLVIFASRLAERKRPLFFVRAAALVSRTYPSARFELWGPDEGEAGKVEAEIRRLRLMERCSYNGPLTGEQTRALLMRAQVLVLPSRKEPFPMVVLEALSAGLPCVITDDTGVSQTLGNEGAAIVTDGTTEGIAAGILSLIESSQRWHAVSNSAIRAANKHFAITSVGEAVEAAYRASLADS